MNTLFTDEHSTVCYYLIIDKLKGLCANYHLLQEEASLMKIERCSDLWMQQ